MDLISVTRLQLPPLVLKCGQEGAWYIDCTGQAIFTYNTKKEKVSIYDG